MEDRDHVGLTEHNTDGRGYGFRAQPLARLPRNDELRERTTYPPVIPGRAQREPGIPTHYKIRVEQSAA